MKALAAALFATLIGLSAFASTSTTSEYKFVFNPHKKDSFTLTQKAPSKEAAFKLVAKTCFQQLTGGKYPGEERGLDIIDICANPKM